MGLFQAYSWASSPTARSLSAFPAPPAPSTPLHGNRIRSTTAGGRKHDLVGPATPPGTSQSSSSSLYSNSDCSLADDSDSSDLSDNAISSPSTPGTDITAFTPVNKHASTTACDRQLLSPSYLSSPTPAPSSLASTHNRNHDRGIHPSVMPPSFSYDLSTSYTFQRPPRSKTHERCNPFFHQHARPRRAPPHCFGYDSSYLRACYAPPRVRSMGSLIDGGRDDGETRGARSGRLG